MLVGGMYGIQFITIFFYFIVYTKKLANMKLFIFSLTFSICQAITILIASLTVDVNNLDIMNIIVRFVSVTMLLCIPSKLNISKEALRKFMLSIVTLGLVACAYNLIINYSDIPSILSASNPYSVNFTSFYLNRNSFAQLLFFAIIANTFLWIEKKTKFAFLTYLIFGVSILLTLSRTVSAVVMIFFMFLIILYFRKRLVTRSVIIFFVIGLFLLINSNQEIRNFISTMIVRKNYGTSGRSNLWMIGIEILNRTNWLFGTGYISSMNVIQDMGYNLSEFHSFYIETLVGGGLIDLLLHLVIFIFIFKKIVYIYKHDRKVGILYFASYIAFAIYAIFESASFFSMGYVGSLFTIFFITIPLLYSNNLVINNIANDNKNSKRYN